MIITIIILILLLAASLYVVRNLLLKNEQAEDLIISYENHIVNLGQLISQADEKIKEIDAKGLFDSDDEIGWFFTHIKSIQKDMNNFNPNK
jgi:hypothetical protein